ncbi:MAG: hypothetical protein JNJ99_07995 [Crocinitomicaceae bacterium]|nr:hypothetical protein [Crocinitomicaceae bacterium]
MKIYNSLLILAGLSFVSCKEEVIPTTTSFQLMYTDYYTMDTLPNIGFSFSGTEYSYYNFYATTNEYGNFDTIISHDKVTNFYCSVFGNDKYYQQFGGTNNITGGTNTMLNIPLLSVGTIDVDYDCSGTGFIQSVLLYRSMASPDTFPDPNSNYATQAVLYPDCNYNTTRNVYSGMWVVQYDYKPNSSSLWETFYDTLEVLPDQVTYHTLVY